MLRGWMNPVVLVRFIGFYLRQLGAANAQVAWEALSPGLQITPGIIAIPMSSRTPVEITLFANLITFTPGTLSVDVDPAEGQLYVHGLHVRDPESFRNQLADLENRLLEVLR